MEYGYYYIDEGEATPSLAQAIQMKKLSQAGVLTEERIEAILSEEKPNQKPKIKVPMERIQKYFSPDASVQEIEDTIVKALSAYRRSQELQMAKAKMFQIIDGKLMPSLASIEGMGDKAAEAVEEASKDGPYLSLDDFRQRTKVSKTVIDKMVELGILSDLPESNQLSLFDL